MCFMMVAITGDGAKHRYVAKQSKDEYEPDDTYKRDIEPPVLPRCVGIRLLLQGSQYPPGWVLDFSTGSPNLVSGNLVDPGGS